MSKIDLVSILVRQLCEVDGHESDLAEDALYDFVSNYNRENDLYNFSKRNVHFSPFFRGSSSSLEYHLKGF